MRAGDLSATCEQTGAAFARRRNDLRTHTGHGDHEHPRAEPTLSVAELLDRVAAERGLNFEPTPPAVTAALPELVAGVERVMQRLHDAQEWRWLAAALAAPTRPSVATWLCCSTADCRWVGAHWPP